jgi:hypothetical protein
VILCSYEALSSGWTLMAKVEGCSGLYPRGFTACFWRCLFEESLAGRCSETKIKMLSRCENDLIRESLSSIGSRSKRVY